jgi:cell division protein FtsB
VTKPYRELPVLYNFLNFFPIFQIPSTEKLMKNSFEIKCLKPVNITKNVFITMFMYRHKIFSGYCRKSKKIVAKRKKTGKIKNRQTMRKSRRKEACRVKLKKTSLLTKLLILAVVIYALVTLVGLQDRIADANAEVARLEEQVLYAEQNYALIEQDLEDLGSDQSVKKIARTRLGMVEAGEIVFHDGDVQD